MTPKYPAFTSLSEAIEHARDIVKGDIHISDEGGESEISEVEWLLKAKPLGLQIWNLFLGLHKASKYTAEELSVEPGLTLCDQAIQGKKAIDCTKHLAFVEGITQMMDKILIFIWTSVDG